VPDSRNIQCRVVRRADSTRDDERANVIEALLGTPARIAPKYLYDELGCALYGAICLLPEYYPTRTEAALFREHRADIARRMARRGQFVDLGAGDCRKAEEWLPFLDPARYIAVDLAVPELERALARMAPDFPEVEMIGVVADFERGLPIDDLLDGRPATFFYPGSSIGNFCPGDAKAFLTSIQQHCAERSGSALLIGIDGRKPKHVLDAAYGDSLGVTAAFNRNVLLHLNRRFGFEFDHEAFAHRAFYDAARGRVEMHLEARRAHCVTLAGHVRPFATGERIHTESSYKYTAQDFETLLRDAGFASVTRWASPGDGYLVFCAA
jgi:L-histidine N-alpha-methyltransferase